MIAIDIEIAKFIGRLPAIIGTAVCRTPNLALSPRVAAALVRRSPVAVRSAINSGTLPVHTYGAGSYTAITLADLARWAGRRTEFEPADLLAACRRIGGRQDG